MDSFIKFHDTAKIFSQFEMDCVTDFWRKCLGDKVYIWVLCCFCTEYNFSEVFMTLPFLNAL